MLRYRLTRSIAMATWATAILDRARLGCPETLRDDLLHVSERLLNLHEVQRHYLLSLEERDGVHLSAVDSDYDERNVTTMLTLT